MLEIAIVSFYTVMKDAMNIAEPDLLTLLDELLTLPVEAE